MRGAVCGSPSAGLREEAEPRTALCAGGRPPKELLSIRSRRPRCFRVKTLSFTSKTHRSSAACHERQHLLAHFLKLDHSSTRTLYHGAGSDFPSVRTRSHLLPAIALQCRAAHLPSGNADGSALPLPIRSRLHVPSLRREYSNTSLLTRHTRIVVSVLSPSSAAEPMAESYASPGLSIPPAPMPTEGGTFPQEHISCSYRTSAPKCLLMAKCSCPSTWTMSVT